MKNTRSPESKIVTSPPLRPPDHLDANQVGHAAHQVGKQPPATTFAPLRRLVARFHGATYQLAGFAPVPTCTKRPLSNCPTSFTAAVRLGQTSNASVTNSPKVRGLRPPFPGFLILLMIVSCSSLLITRSLLNARHSKRNCCFRHVGGAGAGCRDLAYRKRTGVEAFAAAETLRF